MINIENIDELIQWLKANVETGKIVLDIGIGYRFDYVLKFRLPKHIFKTKIFIKGDIFNRMHFMEEFRVEIHTLFSFLIITNKNQKRKICNVAKKIMKKELEKW